MFKLLFFFLALTLSPNLAIASEDCKPLLPDQDSLRISADTPRMTVSDLTTDVYSLLKGDKALDSKSPLRVLTYKGEDLLLAIDARRAFEMGPEEFVKTHLAITPNENNRLWFDYFKVRFNRYKSEKLVVKGLASLWGDIEALRNVDRILFMRFFDSHLETQALDELKTGGFKTDRIALVSLKIPQPEAIRATLRRVTPSSAPFSIKVIKSSQNKKSALPDRIIRQLPPKKGKPIYLTESEYTLSKKMRISPKTFEALVESSSEVLRSYSDTIILIRGVSKIYDSILEGKMPYNAYEIKFFESEAYTEVRLMSVTPMSSEEISAHMIGVVKEHLDPAGEPYKLKAETYPEIEYFVPNSLYELFTSISFQGEDFRMNSIFHALGIIEQVKPEFLNVLSSMPRGETRAFTLNLASRWIEAMTYDPLLKESWYTDYYQSRDVSFYKDFAGRIFLISFVKSVERKDP